MDENQNESGWKPSKENRDSGDENQTPTPPQGRSRMELEIEKLLGGLTDFVPDAPPDKKPYTQPNTKNSPPIGPGLESNTGGGRTWIEREGDKDVDCTGKEMMAFYEALMNLAIHYKRDHHQKGVDLFNLCMSIMFGRFPNDMEYMREVAETIIMTAKVRGLDPFKED